MKDAVADLLKYPIPKSRRLHPLAGFKNPKVYTIDVFSNHAYKISLEIEGDTATLRRVATHKVIDRSPLIHISFAPPVGLFRLQRGFEAA